VYVRRRVVLIVGIIAAIAIVWLLIAQPWRSAAQAGPDSSAGQQKTADAGVAELPVPGDTSGAVTATSTPAATPTATPASDSADSTATGTGATPTAVPTATPCRSGDILVEAVTDKSSYASGQNPLLSIRLTNNGENDCSLNVGTTTQVFTISSGTDTWWRSTDCQSEPSDMVVLIGAGQTVSSAAPLTWDRTRSSVSSCADPNRPRAPGGGATYHLDVEIGGISSTQSAEMLLY
jgi:hypothetical protein